METRIIAYCGITCSSCEAYLATQSGDPKALEKVAAAWREQYDPNITFESVICDGCLVDTERVCSNCPVCPVRVCAKERGVASCAHCGDYVCGHLERHFSFAPEMRAVLDAIRETYLVQTQASCSGKRYNRVYENTDICPRTYSRRKDDSRSRLTQQGCLPATAVPDHRGECAQGASAGDRTGLRV